MPTPDRLWSDLANWSAGMLYFAKADPRLIVPKRRRALGWTINFGHRFALPVLIGVVILPSIVVSALAAARP